MITDAGPMIPPADSLQPFSRIFAFSTKGTGSNDEKRLLYLLQQFPVELLPFDKSKKISSFLSLLRSLRRSKRQLIVMEGTGIFGGMACLISRVLFGHRYVVSSGDAVGPFVGAHVRMLGLPFGVYERLLCRASSGFIGWTPYLVGRALTFGAPCGVTAPGWVIGECATNREEERSKRRANLGIAKNCIVFGLAGAIIWNRRYQYCYGLELVRAIRKTTRKDIAVVIIGDGTGLDKLRIAAGEDLGKRVFLPGCVPLNEVMSSLCVMDIASLPQSTDAVGAFRYTTKVSEYRASKLPIITSRIPVAYDLNLGKCWRLPGSSPWDPIYVDSIKQLMENMTLSEVDSHRNDSVVIEDEVFQPESQALRISEFLRELVETLSLRR